VTDDKDHCCTYYDQNGQPVYQKFRNKDKAFWFTKLMEGQVPATKECQLFGQQVWGERSNRKVVITEGEIDAMSVAQAMDFKVPVVSIPAGVGSAQHALKANYRWLDRFEEIILWMDNDEPGRAVVEGCASLFEIGKVKNIQIDGVKDASELLSKGDKATIYQAVWAAVTYGSEGIINAAYCASDMENPDAEIITDYPWTKVQGMTRGMWSSEVVYHVAGTGVGKTSQIVEIQNHLLENGIKFGVMRFEDTRRKTQLDLMSIKAGKRLHLDPLPEEEMKILHTEVFGSELVELFDPESAQWNFKSILQYIRYMAKGLDCKVIFIDPLSFLVAGTNESDERKALDKVAYEFARAVKQLKISLHIAHHLRRTDGAAHEEGGAVSINHLRGSGGIAAFSMTIFGYERDQQGDRPDLTLVRILKNRNVGTTGVADTLKWDNVSGRNLMTSDEYPTKRKDGKEATQFGPIGREETDY
jgi:twinkle protein